MIYHNLSDPRLGITAGSPEKYQDRKDFLRIPSSPVGRIMLSARLGFEPCLGTKITHAVWPNIYVCVSLCVWCACVYTYIKILKSDSLNTYFHTPCWSLTVVFSHNLLNSFFQARALVLEFLKLSVDSLKMS